MMELKKQWINDNCVITTISDFVATMPFMALSGKCCVCGFDIPRDRECEIKRNGIDN